MTAQALSYVATARSNLSLMERSRSVSGAQIADARSQLSTYLASRFLIYPTAFSRVGLKPGMSFLERKQALNLDTAPPVMSPEERDFTAFLETAGRKARRQSWIWRIGSEMEYMRDSGWFPFFVTLTVDPSRVADSETMWKQGIEFRRYLRRLGRVSAAACGSPNAIRDGESVSNYVRHVGIIEHGKTNQHHHMHVLIWMRGIPDKWKRCPNSGIGNPRSRSIDYCREMGTYWPNSLPGIGKAKFFRHEGDVWSALGFCLPVNRNTGKVINCLPARAAGYYVAKYMEKGDKAWLHRVKATRGLGLTTLRDRLLGMHLRHLEALTWRPRSHPLSISLTTMHSVPAVLLRSQAKLIYFCRRWGDVSEDLTQLLLPNCAVFKGMLESVRNGVRPQRMSLAVFYDWVTSHLPEPSGYCERRLTRAHLQLRADFLPFVPKPVRHFGGSLNE